MKSVSTFILSVITLTAALAPLGAQTSPAPCSKETVWPGPVGPPFRFIDVQSGTPLNEDQIKVLNAAKGLIAGWEEDCPTLPKLDCSQGLIAGGGVKISDIWDTVTFCVQTSSSVNDATNAIAVPADSSTFGTDSNGNSGTYEKDGAPGININPELLVENPDPGKRAGDLEMLASVLVHEFYHIACPPSSPNDPEGDRESGAYTFQAEYLCALKGCEANLNAPLQFPCSYIRFANDKLCHYGKPQVSCPICPNEGKVECSQQLSGSSFERRVLTFTFEGALMINVLMSVRPDINQIEFITTSAGVEGTKILDLYSAVPGFNVTCFENEGRNRLEYITLGGYDSTTGEGMIVRVDLDFDSSPFYAATIRYRGTAFGAPYDLSIHESKPNFVAVLDSISSSVIGLKLVPGTSVVLASLSDAPLLSQCRYLYSRRTQLNSTSPLGGVLWASSYSEGAFMNGFMNAFENGAEVLISDFDLDGSPDHIGW